MGSSLLHDILTMSSGNRYCRFANADGKVWIMPVRNMDTAMNIYQPSGAKGKIMKRWFPYLSWSRAVRKVVHAEKVSCVLRSDLYDLLLRVLDVDDFEFSVFGGTPSVHQKITIQLSRGKHILGYLKLSDNVEIIDLFHREAETLAFLAQRGLADCVPQALYCGKLENGIGVFVQSTVKTNNSRIVHEWSSLQDDFLVRLQQATRRSILFEESDFYRNLMALRAYYDWLPKHIDRAIIDKSIDRVLSKYAGQKVEFSAYHADFTPWNMFVEGGKLFVFDFEYAQRTYPSGLDKYHFFTQTAIFEKHWQVKEIISFLQLPESDWVDRDLYLCYLLDIISRFTLRERGTLTGDVEKSFCIWLDLLKELN